jgi:putative addiction module component (TIGR02574 family)
MQLAALRAAADAARSADNATICGNGRIEGMARSARELFEEAMRLDPEERATLMRLLIESLDAESEEGVEDAWRVEIERRMAELDSGSVQTIPWEEVKGDQSGYLGLFSAAEDVTLGNPFGLFGRGR